MYKIGAKIKALNAYNTVSDDGDDDDDDNDGDDDDDYYYDNNNNNNNNNNSHDPCLNYTLTILRLAQNN
jgi:hypothetical protein